MERGLERCAGCLLKLDPRQNAPLRCMQGTCTVHTYHLTIRLRRVHRFCVWHRSVNYAAGAIGKRRNFIILILCAILRYCQTTRSWDDVYHPPFTRCDLHRQIYWLTLCAWYMQHSQSFTHQSNTCVIRRLAFLNLGFIEQMSPSTTSHRRILVCPRTAKSWDRTESACSEFHERQGALQTDLPNCCVSTTW